MDRSVIGHVIGPRTIEVEKAPLRLFAKVMGETNPIYTDHDAAILAGYRSLLVPPTYVFCLKVEAIHPLEHLDLLGVEVDLGRTFHAEQGFVYHQPVCAGDELTFEERIVDIYEKKGGSLTFVSTETTARNQDSSLTTELIFTTVFTALTDP